MLGLIPVEYAGGVGAGGHTEFTADTAFIVDQHQAIAAFECSINGTYLYTRRVIAMEALLREPVRGALIAVFHQFYGQPFLFFFTEMPFLAGRNTILPLLTSNCAMSGCHDVASHKEGLILNNYTGIMRIVRAGNASGSKLVSVITTSNNGDVMPPPPAARLTTAQIDLIKKWINQGAKNNTCASCDTATFTYSAAVKTILGNKCVGCHTGASAGGGVELSTYNGVKASAQAGTLLGSIQQKAGYEPMPQGGAKLPDCEITQIQKWITAGALNN